MKKAIKPIVGVLVFLILFYLLFAYGCSGEKADPAVAKELVTTNASKALAEKEAELVAIERANLANKAKLEEEKQKKEEEVEAKRLARERLRYEVERERLRCEQIVIRARANKKLAMLPWQESSRAWQAHINKLKFELQSTFDAEAKKAQVDVELNRLQTGWDEAIGEAELKIKLRLRQIESGTSPSAATAVDEVLYK